MQEITKSNRTGCAPRVQGGEDALLCAGYRQQSRTSVTELPKPLTEASQGSRHCTSVPTLLL